MDFGPPLSEAGRVERKENGRGRFSLRVGEAARTKSRGRFGSRWDRSAVPRHRDWLCKLGDAERTQTVEALRFEALEDHRLEFGLPPSNTRRGDHAEADDL